MAFVEDMIFVVGLTGLVYFITDELLFIASVSHNHSKTKLGSSRIDFSKQNRHKDSVFNDVVQKDSVFNDTQVAKIDDFAQSDCSGAGKSVVFNDTQEEKVDYFVQRECSGAGQSVIFTDTQEAKVDYFVERECPGVGQSVIFNDTQEAKVDYFVQSDCSGVGQSVIFNDTQEAEVDYFVQRECSGVGQSVIFNDTQEAKKVDYFVQRECSGVGQSCNGELENEGEVVTERKCPFDEKDCLGGDILVDQVVDQNFEFRGLDRGVEKLFEETPQRDELMEDEEDVCFNAGVEIDKNEEEGWEDDWEGIERTELEKQFGAAVAFVNSKNNADPFFGVVSSVKIKLYGLHKVAIEGICMKQPPIALKVYSRAKWNAWKQLDNMSREEAMEKYITLLSRTIPGWMDDRQK